MVFQLLFGLLFHYFRVDPLFRCFFATLKFFGVSGPVGPFAPHKPKDEVFGRMFLGHWEPSPKTPQQQKKKFPKTLKSSRIPKVNLIPQK